MSALSPFSYPLLNVDQVANHPFSISPVQRMTRRPEARTLVSGFSRTLRWPMNARLEGPGGGAAQGSSYRRLIVEACDSDIFWRVCIGLHCQHVLYNERDDVAFKAIGMCIHG